MIAFRVDINKEIASGHIMRCITIAKKIISFGEKVLFICSDNYCDSFLTSLGIPYVTTNGDWQNWDKEIGTIKSIISGYSINCLFVDSYVVSNYYLKTINDIIPVAYIDDYLTSPLPVTLLIAPTQSKDLSFVPEMYKGFNTKLLLGKDYLIIRDEFLLEKDNLTKDGILITTGGSDKYHFTLNFINVILNNPLLCNEKYYVIIGSMNDDEEEIRKITKDYPNFILLKNISNMGDYMHSSKYAISAGGNTIYELLCCHVPISCIALSNDQVALGERLASFNYLSYEGDCRIDINNVVKSSELSLVHFLQNGINSNIHEAILSFTDGMGAVRIAENIINLIK